jgi:hypothetical protein
MVSEETKIKHREYIKTKYQTDSVYREKQNLRIKNRYKTDPEFRQRIIRQAKEYVKLHGSSYQRDPAFRERAKKYAREHRTGEKAAAHLLVAIALQKGKLIKPDKCSRCDSQGKLLAHHTDYFKPLKVNWLCYSCHQIILFQSRG